MRCVRCIHCICCTRCTCPTCCVRGVGCERCTQTNHRAHRPQEHSGVPCVGGRGQTPHSYLCMFSRHVISAFWAKFPHSTSLRLAASVSTNGLRLSSWLVRQKVSMPTNGVVSHVIGIHPQIGDLIGACAFLRGWVCEFARKPACVLHLVVGVFRCSH